MEVVSVALRRGTTAEWEGPVFSQLILRTGELGFDIEKRHLKSGDNIHNWAALPIMFDLSHMPVAAVDVYIDTSEAAMLAREVSVGDICIRPDVSTTFVYGGLTLGWVEFESPTGTTPAIPSGPAGGVLSGTYPNPGFAEDMATQAELDNVSSAVASLDAEVNVLESEVDTVEANVAALQAADAAFQTALTNLQNALTALQGSVGDFLTEAELPDALGNMDSAVVVKSGGALGFYGKAPGPRGAALTPQTASGVDVVTVLGISVLGGNSATAINNLRTRVAELEARLKGYGLLP